MSLELQKKYGENISFLMAWGSFIHCPVVENENFYWDIQKKLAVIVIKTVATWL